MKRILNLLSLSLMGCTLLIGAPRSEVVKHSDMNVSLEKRWSWGQKVGKSQSDDGYWVGYSIEKMMSENSFIGCYHDGNDEITLHEIIYG